MGMALGIHVAIENIIKLRVKTRESMPETQSDFLSKYQKSKITCEMIQNQNQKSVL